VKVGRGDRYRGPPMATISPPRRAPSPTVPRALEERRRRVPWFVWAALTIVGVAGALYLWYGPRFVNYDAQWALVWASDLWSGHLPEYTADFAPTPHPLATALSSLALPFGHSAHLAIVWITLLCFGALVYLTYRLGAELFNGWVGLVAALVVATRPAMIRDTLIGYQDLPFAVLVVGAVLAETRRPRRGTLVLALLAVAGLLRPEAWLLAGLYWLYLWPHATTAQRVKWAAIVASAPLIWAATDWIVAGDPLHSFHGTTALAEEADRRRDPQTAPYWTAKYFAYVLREPMVIGIPIGLAFAWLYVRRRAFLPAAVVVAMVAVFAGGSIFGLPLIRRYVDTPAVLLTLFYGLAVCGWTLLPRGRARTRWMVLGGVALAASIAFLPWHVSMLDGPARRVNIDKRMYGSLQRILETKRVRKSFARCPSLTAADHRPIPFARFWLDAPPGTVHTVESGASPMGKLLLMPRRTRATRRVYTAKTFPKVAVPAGYRMIRRNRAWRVFAAPECRPGLTRPPS
jgi:hypothetical protein